MTSIKNRIRFLTLSVLGFTDRVAHGVHILNGHYLSREDIEVTTFEKLLLKLSKEADFISSDEASLIILNKKSNNRKLIAFTFDDGFEECYTKIAPALEKFGAIGTFFINPGIVDCKDSKYINDFNQNKVHLKNKNYMTSQMIRDLSNRGHIIGSHTIDHEKLSNLDLESLKKQIIESKNLVERITNKTCSSFAFPYGQITDINKESYELMLNNYQFVYSSCFSNYYTINKVIVTRRHFEGDWPFSHLKYFLNKKKYSKEIIFSL